MASRNRGVGRRLLMAVNHRREERYLPREERPKQTEELHLLCSPSPVGELKARRRDPPGSAELEGFTPVANSRFD